MSVDHLQLSNAEEREDAVSIADHEWECTAQNFIASADYESELTWWALSDDATRQRFEASDAFERAVARRLEESRCVPIRRNQFADERIQQMADWAYDAHNQGLA